MKTLIILSAYPASGKTTWAKKYQKEHEDVFIINSDEVRLELTGGNYHDRSKQKEVWELFEKRIHEYALKAENATVILDALNDVNSVRLKYLKNTPEFDKKILVMFPSTLERSRYFNSLRPDECRVPDNIIVEMFKKFEQPNEEVLSYIDELIEVKW